MISLTHWGRDKKAAIFHMTFWNAFPWLNMYEFWFKISLKFVPKGPVNNIPALDNGLVPARQQAIYWTTDGGLTWESLSLIRENDVSSGEAVLKMHHRNVKPMSPKYINGLVQDCSNSIANALELLQSCRKPLISWSSLQKRHSKYMYCINLQQARNIAITCA